MSVSLESEGLFSRRVVERKDVFALVVDWALSGKQSRMGGSSVGSRRNVDLLEAPRHKVFSVIFGVGSTPGRIPR